MRDFACPHCRQRLAFENSICLNCGSRLAFDLDARGFAILEASGSRHACANRNAIGCNWLAEPDQSGGWCRSCALTRTRPAANDAEAMAELALAEAAKRRLVVELVELGLPITAKGADPADPGRGIAFDLLSSAHEPVLTGHDSGLITLDLAEGDDLHREQLRISMDEPYRTVLGHFRHEIGHYYFGVLVDGAPARSEFTALFGDPDADYQAALDRHYSVGPPPGWRDSYISAYATMHPAEDWAETFAHYLHIRDTIDTAAAFGFAPKDTAINADTTETAGVDPSAAVTQAFDRMIATWLPLTWSLNMINRSMGHADLYPFVISAAALKKMRLVHALIAAC